MENNNQAYDFNATIEIPEQEFILLPEGTYQFTVTKVERGYHQPNPQNPGKIPAGTGVVTVYLSINTNEGTAIVKDRFFMHPSVNWRIGAFHKAVGLIPEESKQVTMNWDGSVGKTGYCSIKHVQGNQATFMNVEKYLKPSQASTQQVQATPQPNYNV